MMRRNLVLICLGLLLLSAAAGLTGYNIWTDMWAGECAESTLAQLRPLIPDDPAPALGRTVYQRSAVTGEERLDLPDSVEYPDYVLNPKMNMPVETVDGIEYVGTLKLTTLGLELPVINDWDYEHLKSAPCRYTGTAYLDDMVICAHNYDRHFGRLKSLRYGDSVTFTDMDGNVFEYSVTEIETLQPTAVTDMTDSGHDLTLFTCTLGGEARVAVRCDKVNST